ncbi:ATP-binding protein [Streptomyces sp. NPDC006367]|uniref:ATP-binding protein n=1 Tax=unclassified Streptomyces TaxID=2593676 RepID=UPI00339E4864
MDPNDRGPEEHGHDGHTPRPRAPRDPLTPDFGQHTPALARTVQLVSGDFLLTVNPVDGSEIEVCPPGGTFRSSEFGSGGERPGRPEKLTAAERAEVDRAARPPVPPGPARSPLGLLARDDERERLARLLARGRSVRLTGPAGSGRTSLLDVVAEDCAGLAPDGVVRLNGFRRTADDLLYDLFHAVHRAPLHRPERDELLGLVREIGAVVVLDDVEFGGAALDELLDATPECAFLLAATPDVPAPSAGSAVEEVFLTGLDRSDGVELLERSVGRPLTDEEANWAGDLWFESEGLPLRFVQAGALLRRRDRLRAGADAVDEFGVFADTRPADDTPYDAVEGDEVPLPSVGEAAAPAPLLASRLSASARATLEFAVALGGEVPHQAHLPALVGDTHADAALGELADCGLLSPVGSRYRLAAGVLAQLEAAGYADDVRERATAAAAHYAWWAGHPSVTPERVCAEADAVLAALAVLVPTATPSADGEESPAVRLARAAAPAFAAGLHWSAWQRALRSGAEASRLAGDVAEQAYFHHELGVLALCEGRLDRARAELEASIGLRGALSDKRGAVAGRRALALVADRAGDTPGPGAGVHAPGAAGTGPGAAGPGAVAGLGVVGAGSGATAGDEVPEARHEESASPAAGVPAPFPPLRPAPQSPTLVVRREQDPGASRKAGGGIKGLARRNLVAAGAGALLVAVLGTVVTLGATSDNDAGTPSDQVGVNPSASQGVDDGTLGADRPKDDGDGSADTGEATFRPADPGPDGTPGTSDDPTPTESGRPSGGSSGSPGPTDPSGTGGPSGSGGPTKTQPPASSKPPVSSRPPASSEPPTGSPSGTPTTEPPSETPTSEAPPPSTPETSDSASGPSATRPGTTTPTTASAPAGGTASATRSGTATGGAQTTAATGQTV